MSAPHNHNHDHDHAHDSHGHSRDNEHGSGHSHGHGGHGHGGHGHSHAPASFGRAFAIGTALNLGFVAVEAVYGIASGSMSLLADAGHNLSDVLGLGIAWTAASLGKRAPKGRYTYGLRSSSILAALVNALMLLVAIGVIAVEAIGRFFAPEPVQGVTMMIVAAIGILINGGTALLFAGGRDHDINIRGAFVHMAADAAISAGVVVAGFVILKTGLVWIDPAVSLIVTAIVAIGTWSLLRDSVNMSLHAAPPGIDPGAVADFLAAEPGVSAIHDLHIWPMSTTETALTAHLILPAGYPGPGFASGIADRLKQKFGIDHTTIQIEIDDCGGCTLHAEATV
jgi:cobalt-zinc-cadmium efflux system protein